MHRIPHGPDADPAAVFLLPGFNSVAEPRVRILLGVTTQPLEVYGARIIAASRFGSHVIRFAMPPQQTTDSCQADPKHVGSLFVGARLPRAVGRNNTSTQIQ